MEVASRGVGNEEFDLVTNDTVEDQKNIMSLVYPNSRALSGSYSDSSSSGTDDICKGAAVKVTAELENICPAPREPSTFTPPLLSSNNIDYFDVPGFSPPPPPSSDIDETPLLSLSHPGTLSKRKRTASPNQYRDDNKRTKRECTSDLSGSVSILERKRRMNQWDVQAATYPVYQSTSFLAEPAHNLPRKPIPVIAETLRPEDHRLAHLNPRSFAPKGPRALGGGTLICFYWYHKGHCKPRRGKHERPIRCTYAHTLDVPHAQVSFPPGIDRHDLDCSLRLCPVRLGHYNYDVISNGARSRGERYIKEASHVPPKLDAFPVDTYFSSSSSDRVAEARAFVREPKFNGNPKYQQLPQLTGAKREPFKAQKTKTKNWQVDNCIKPFDVEKKRATNRAAKKAQREGEMQKKRSMLESDFGAAIMPAKEISKRTKESVRQRRARKLFEIDAARGGWIENFDPEAELYNGFVQTITGLPDESSLQDTQKEIEDRQLCAAKDRVIRAKRTAGSKGLIGRKTRENKKINVLVDYELPMGADSLDWDTDLVRKVFGEIEQSCQHSTERPSRDVQRRSGVT